MDVGLVRPQSLSLWGIEIGHLPLVTQFLLCSSGVFVFHCTHGYLQEFVFKIPGFQFGLYLTLFELLVYMVCGMANYNPFKEHRRAPLVYHIVISVLLLGANGLGNASLAYLNYPTKVIIRSGKVIPTMLCGFFVTQRSYSPLQYFGAALMSAGLTLFTLADNSVSPEFNLYGVVLASSSVVADALLANVQEKILKEFRSPQSEMIFYSNFAGLVQILFITAFTGELQSATALCMENKASFFILMSEAMMGYSGGYFYFTIVRRFGAVVAIFVACTRKALTLVLSFLLFPKPFTGMYVYSGCMFFAGFALNVFESHRSWISNACTSWRDKRKGIDQREW